MLTEDNMFNYLHINFGFKTAINVYNQYNLLNKLIIKQQFINHFEKLIDYEYSNEEKIIMNYPYLEDTEVINNEISVDSSYLYCFEKLVEEKTDEVIKTTDEVMKIIDIVTKNEINKKYIKKHNFSCKLCGNFYKSTDAVRKHWRKHHKNIEAKRGKVLSYSIPLT